MRTTLSIIIALSFLLVGFSLGRIDRDVTARDNAAKVAKLKALYAR